VSISVITSCSLDGWKRYGQRCITTLLHHWPKGIPIHIVSEDALPLHDLSKNLSAKIWLSFWPLNDNPLARDFYEQHRNTPACRGMKTNKYNFRQDAWRFSKKVFAIDLVAPKMNGRLIWLDADTVTFANVPIEFLQRMPPDDYGIAHLDRPGYHSECGWIGYNLEVQGVRQFIARFAALYYSKEVFTLKEWHDSWVFDWLRKQMPEVKSWAIPYKSSVHPFVYSELGQYMDHLKGARKQTGISHDHPRFNRRKG
jgi:hypothetical protein